MVMCFTHVKECRSSIVCCSCCIVNAESSTCTSFQHLLGCVEIRNQLKIHLKEALLDDLLRLCSLAHLLQADLRSESRLERIATNANPTNARACVPVSSEFGHSLFVLTTPPNPGHANSNALELAVLTSLVRRQAHHGAREQSLVCCFWCSVEMVLFLAASTSGYASLLLSASPLHSVSTSLWLPSCANQINRSQSGTPLPRSPENCNSFTNRSRVLPSVIWAPATNPTNIFPPKCWRPPTEHTFARVNCVVEKKKKITSRERGQKTTDELWVSNVARFARNMVHHKRLPSG